MRHSMIFLEDRQPQLQEHFIYNLDFIYFCHGLFRYCQ